MKEIWKKFIYNDIETKYSVSNLGRVRNDNTDYILKPHVHKKTKYHMVPLTINGKTKLFSLSRMVATLFIPNPNNYEEVDHVTCDRYRNEAHNLEWVTHEENMRRALVNGLVYKNDGSMRYVFHNENDIRKLCELLSNTCIPVDELSKITNISQNTINKIRLGKRWRNISKDYDFSEYNKFIQKNYIISHSGENNSQTKYPDTLVHSICHELELNRKTISEIAKMFNVQKNYVYELRIGKVRTLISSQYDVSNHDLTEFGYHQKDLNKINGLLKKDYTVREIINKLNLPDNKKTIAMIYGRKRNMK